MFDKVYSRNESLFRYGTELIVADRESMECIGEDGLHYTLQIAPWEKEDFLKEDSSTNGWVRCDDFLPCNKQRVLLTLDEMGVIYTVEYATFHSSGVTGERNYFEQDGFVIPSEEIVAWMPLPEPYNETDTESDE